MDNAADAAWVHLGRVLRVLGVGTDRAEGSTTCHDRAVGCECQRNIAARRTACSSDVRSRAGQRKEIRACAVGYCGCAGAGGCNGRGRGDGSRDIEGTGRRLKERGRGYVGILASCHSFSSCGGNCSRYRRSARDCHAASDLQRNVDSDSERQSVLNLCFIGNVSRLGGVCSLDVWDPCRCH